MLCSTIFINNDLKATTDGLAECMLSRLALHAINCVDVSRRKHFTIGFTRDNIDPLATGMCLSGHIVKEIDNFRIDERLLDFPNFRPGNESKVATPPAMVRMGGGLQKTILFLRTPTHVTSFAATRPCLVPRGGGPEK